MPNDQDNQTKSGGETLESSPPSQVLENPSGLTPSAAPPPKPSLLHRLRNNTNLYLLVFILLILAAAAVVYVTVRQAHDSTTTKSVGSLTDQQLADLKGNTTLVGDAKQTLDVQSNSIFEGQVLIRSDLNVAGAIKVGGGLSLDSITVGGAGDFGQLGINGGLNVGGNTILQGQLTVQKNLTVGGTASFGSLSVGSLTTSSLQLNGSITVRHVSGSGGNPGRSNGSALGGGGTASVSGSDTAGTITINTGGSPPAGCFVTVDFSQKFAAAPHVVISPANSSAAALQYYAKPTSSGFSVCSANTPSSSRTYIFDYVVIA